MLRIGELARKVGVTTQAIRYYERVGLLGNTTRSPSGYRLYDEETEGFLRFLKKAQGLGFTLQEVKTIWEIRATGRKPCGYVSEQTQKKIDELDRKIRELQDLRQMLVDMQNEWQTLEPLQDGSQCICPLIEGVKRGTKHITGGNRDDKKAKSRGVYGWMSGLPGSGGNGQ